MQAVIVVYSTDPSVRADVRAALGASLAGTDLEFRETATVPAVLAELDKGDIDCCILDADATPAGGMGLSKQIHDEYAECPPVLLLVAREADSWLAAWSRAEAVASRVIDPITFPGIVESLVFVDEPDAA